MMNIEMTKKRAVVMSDPDNSLHFNSFLARGYLPLQNTEIFSTVRNRKISLGKCLISFTFRPEHTLRVHVRTASARLTSIHSANISDVSVFL